MKKRRSTLDIEGLPRPIIPATGIKPKRGEDLGTEGLELFDQATTEAGFKELAKQKNLFDEG
jgi:hypothetical protein